MAPWSPAPPCSKLERLWHRKENSQAQRAVEVPAKRTAFQRIFNDCKPAVWVYNGWVALAYEEVEKPYKDLGWGSGWGATKAEAKYKPAAPAAERPRRDAWSERCAIRPTPVTSRRGADRGNCAS